MDSDKRNGMNEAHGNLCRICNTAPNTAVCKVTIRKNAVYGGLAISRGKKIPDYISGPFHRYTVKDIATNKGVEEALLKEINSWVAISYLTVV